MMRKAVFFVAILIIAGCQSPVKKSETVVRNGVVYQSGEKKPFTGIIEGRAREGYRHRILKYRKHYKNGMLHGMCEFWYPNGKLESQVPYENGRTHGVIFRYYENGQMKARIPIRNGLRGGSTGELFWDKHGNLLKG